MQTLQLSKKVICIGVLFLGFYSPKANAQTISLDASGGMFLPVQYAKNANPEWGANNLGFSASIYLNTGLYYAKNRHKVGINLGQFYQEIQGVINYQTSHNIANDYTYGLSYYYALISRNGSTLSVGLQAGSMHYDPQTGISGGGFESFQRNGTMIYQCSIYKREMFVPGYRQAFITPQLRVDLPLNKHFSFFTQVSVYFAWHKNQYFRSGGFLKTYPDQASYDADIAYYLLPARHSIPFQYGNYNNSEFFRDFRPTATVGIAYNFSLKK